MPLHDELRIIFQNVQALLPGQFLFLFLTQSFDYAGMFGQLLLVLGVFVHPFALWFLFGVIGVS